MAQKGRRYYKQIPRAGEPYYRTPQPPVSQEQAQRFVHMPTVQLANVVDWAATYEGEPYHALLCDPPYELSFMNKKWDASGVSFHASTWAALAKHLHPGAFGMAFASARGWHRMATAIEDAGLIIHPSIFLWAYGSGFPKATRIANDDDAVWAGHRYGLQAIKPAVEPIIVFQKPYDGKPTDSIARTGAGALNIAEGRIGSAEPLSTPGCNTEHDIVAYGPSKTAKAHAQVVAGRWPANFALSHTEKCVLTGQRRVRGSNASYANVGRRAGSDNVYAGGWREDDFRGEVGYADASGMETVEEWACVPDCPVRRLADKNGEHPSAMHPAVKGNYPTGMFNGIGKAQGDIFGDTGTVDRFFYTTNWQLESADPVFYTEKASRAERDAGLEHLANSNRNYNQHPTVKPIDLARWLATLLLPPDAYAPRRLLVPFAGVASECVGAMLAGWEQVTGVEMEKEYVAMANARLAYHYQRVKQLA